MSTWSGLGSWSYSSPQCSPTMTMSAPLLAGSWAIASILSTSMIGTDHGSSAGSGIPFVP